MLLELRRVAVEEQGGRDARLTGHILRRQSRLYIRTSSIEKRGCRSCPMQSLSFKAVAAAGVPIEPTEAPVVADTPLFRALDSA